MIRKRDNSCIDPGFYLKQEPDVSFEESRAIVLSKYEEDELASPLRDLMKTHLGNCNCCRSFAEELGKMEAWKSSEQIQYAVCPSTEALDSYVFERSRQDETEVRRIEKHMLECPMCREETEWIENLGRGNVIEYSKLRSDRIQYAAIAAAMVFLAFAAMLWFRESLSAPPADQLRALAVIKTPQQINYDSLRRSAFPLPASLEQKYEEGVKSFKAGNFKMAAQKLAKVVQASPDHSAALFLLGYCYYQLDEPEKAFELCDKAERMHPHDMERCLSLVNVALKTGHFGRAVQEISVLYHEAPNVPEVRDLYLRIHKLTSGKSIKM